MRLCAYPPGLVLCSYFAPLTQDSPRFYLSGQSMSQQSDFAGTILDVQSGCALRQACGRAGGRSACAPASESGWSGAGACADSVTGGKAATSGVAITRRAADVATAVEADSDVSSSWMEEMRPLLSALGTTFRTLTFWASTWS